MACERFEPMIVERLYGEIAPDEDRELASHLDGCAACRATLDAFSRVREALGAGAVEVALPPRVVVLKERPRFSPALLAASILGAAVLAGAAAGGGYALGRIGSGPAPAAQPAAAGASTPAPVLDAALRKAVDAAVAEKLASAEPARAPEGTPVTAAQLDAAIARLQRDARRDRAADLDYLMGQLTASEVRTGQRIGQTNQALRYVALASNPNVSEQ